MRSCALVAPWKRLVFAAAAVLLPIVACGEGVSASVEVRCVYETGGDPIPGVIVEVVPSDSSGHELRSWVLRRREAKSQATSADGTALFQGIPVGDYDVVVMNPYDLCHMRELGATKFRCMGELPRQTVSLSAEKPRAEVTFRLEKGASLEGHVRRRGGSPLCGVMLSVLERDSGEEVARGVTDDRGHYELRGLSVGRPALLRIVSTDCIRPDELDRLPVVFRRPYVLWEEDVNPREMTNIVDVLQPIWPFPRQRGLVVGVWVGDTASPPSGMPEIRFDLGHGTRVVTSGLACERHEVLLPDMPIGPDLTAAVGVLVPDTRSVPRSVRDYRLFKQIKTHAGVDRAEFAFHAPYAILSRVFWVAAIAGLIAVHAIVLLRCRIRRKTRQ